MNLSNIISAGRMMSIVVALLGAFHCGAAFAQMHTGMVREIAFGALFVVCGLALVVMFGRVARKAASVDAPRPCSPDASHPDSPAGPRPSSSGAVVLAVGTLVMLLGAAGAVLAWRNPFSWMTAIVGIAIFIDALCLRIALSRK